MREKSEHEIIVLKKLEAAIPENSREIWRDVHISVSDQQKHRKMELFLKL